MKKSFTMMRRGRIQDLDRSFDLQFGQKQEPEARFAAAWDLIAAKRASGSPQDLIDADLLSLPPGS